MLAAVSGKGLELPSPPEVMLGRADSPWISPGIRRRREKREVGETSLAPLCDRGHLRQRAPLPERPAGRPTPPEPRIPAISWALGGFSRTSGTCTFS